jgi:hypothetical protein
MATNECIDPEFQAQVLRQVHEIADDLGAFDDIRSHAVVTIAALFTGPDVEAIVQLTGYPRDFVEEIGGRMRASGLWTSATVNYGDWFCSDELRKLIQFTLDLGVAEGKLFRTTEKKNGRWVFEWIGDDASVQ